MLSISCLQSSVFACLLSCAGYLLALPQQLVPRQSSGGARDMAFQILPGAPKKLSIEFRFVKTQDLFVHDNLAIVTCENSRPK